MIDFSSDGEFEDRPAVLEKKDGGMERLSALVEAQIMIEDEIDRLTGELDRQKAMLTKVRTDEIPSLMEELGFSKILTVRGDSVELKDVVQASVPKDGERRDRALQWLRDSGHGDLIKNQVFVVFGRGEDETAEDLLRDLHERGMDAQRKVEVHPMTLAALVRTLRAEGAEVNAEDLNLYEGRISKIKRAKR